MFVVYYLMACFTIFYVDCTSQHHAVLYSITKLLSKFNLRTELNIKNFGDKNHDGCDNTCDVAFAR